METLISNENNDGAIKIVKFFISTFSFISHGNTLLINSSYIYQRFYYVSSYNILKIKQNKYYDIEFFVLYYTNIYFYADV